MNAYDQVHPFDAEKLERLGEALCEVSFDEPATVVDRLLAIADHRLGSEGMADAALAEIRAAS